MSETRINKNKAIVASALATLAMGGSIYALKHSPDSSFKTDIPVPTATQPHESYVVKAGDTESSIAAQLGHSNDLNYENMINEQLPKPDQPDRNLKPGEEILLPTER